jgi:1,4-dihydroxy-2-naphthoate octaprenyltransferase
VTAAAIRPGSLAAWVLAVRPHTLTVSLAPVLVGTGIAVTRDAFSPLPALVALVGALLLQVSSNLANDVFDFRSGADNADRKGPPRAAQQGLLSERALFVGLAVVMTLAFVVGLYLVQLAGWPILASGIAGMVSAVAATAVLSVNNLRDLDTDAPAGKRTMAVRLGARGGRWWYALELYAGYAVVAGLIAADALPLHAALVLLSLPHAARTTATVVAHTDGPTLNRMLGATAKLQILFAVLLLPALLFPGAGS